MPKKLISERTILDAAKRGEKIILADDDVIVTAAAYDRSKQIGIKIEKKHETVKPVHQSGTQMEPTPSITKSSSQSVVDAVIAIGSDHGGFQLKEVLKPFLVGLGYKVIDIGTTTEESCDYPDYAYAVAKMVSTGEASKGIMIDSVGIASAMVANKIVDVRAACCYDEYSARSSREHNDANVMTLGGKVLGSELAKSITKLWLETPYGGGRHQKRLDKITEIESRIIK
ncbi:MAG: ribose 5-phosphate isomerase B [Bacteroidota bacterium]|nr:ribose 5-phosphate isomerase B [Bacteroidota bacterium]